MNDKKMRKASIKRRTNETDIDVSLDIDGSGKYEIDTGIGFLDHMLEQLSRHSLIDLRVKAKGDLHIDGHHTTEDVGIAIGMAMAEALGDKKGIRRYGFSYLPMDEALTRCAIDISGRPWLEWRVSFASDKIGDMDSELFREFFQALAFNAGITLHIENLYGENSHHIIESCFKALARALRAALTIDRRQAGKLPSTKGRLGS